jgi:hypothetical protein
MDFLLIPIVYLDDVSTSQLTLDISVRFFHDLTPDPSVMQVKKIPVNHHVY